MYELLFPCLYEHSAASSVLRIDAHRAIFVLIVMAHRLDFRLNKYNKKQLKWYKRVNDALEMYTSQKNNCQKI